MELVLVADENAFATNMDRADGLAVVERELPLPIYKLLSKSYDLAVGYANAGNGPLASNVVVLGRIRR